MKCNGYIFFAAICFAIYLIRGNFHNTGQYKKVICIVHDHVAVKNYSCSVKSINRTFSVANLRFTPSQVLNNVTVNFEVFKRASIKYRPFLVNITQDVCAFFTSNKRNPYFKLSYLMTTRFSNINHSCPYVGEIILKDIYFDAQMLPSIWPTGEYRLDSRITANNKRMIDSQLFVDLKEIN